MTINEIKEKNLSCVVKVDSEEEAVQLSKAFDPDGHDMVWNYNYLKYDYEKADGTVCFNIEDNKIEGFDTETYFKTKGKGYGTIYNFKDLVRTKRDFCTGFRGGKILTPTESNNGGVMLTAYDTITKEIQSMPFIIPKDRLDAIVDAWVELGCTTFSLAPKTKEDNSMKMTFTTTEGYRVDKSNNGRIPTVTTHVTFINDKGIFRGTATCDKLEYNEREGVLNALANALCGSFDREYRNEVKRQAKRDLHNRTCTTCHQVFDTPEEARAHEKWHIENKKARRQRYLERKEARDRLAEKEREERISKYMKELAK